MLSLHVLGVTHRWLQLAIFVVHDTSSDLQITLEDRDRIAGLPLAVIFLSRLLIEQVTLTVAQSFAHGRGLKVHEVRKTV